MKNKRLYIILLAVPLLLFIPLVAMQFTNEVNWTTSDFVVMGILLLTTGLITEVVLRIVKQTTYRFAALVGIFLVLFLIWAELSVGIFGTPFSGS